jgi:hypothetical protein
MHGDLANWALAKRKYWKNVINAPNESEAFTVRIFAKLLLDDWNDVGIFCTEFHTNRLRTMEITDRNLIYALK